MQMRNAWIDRFLYRRGLRRWTRAAQRAPEMDLAELRRERRRARRLLHPLNEVIAIADNRLALPSIGSDAFPRPHGTDWSWRPDLWTRPLSRPGMSSPVSRSKLGDELSLFHDCPRSELTLRQIRNTREADLAPYGLRMDVFGFDGTFLSLVLDLPVSATDGLTRGHLMGMNIMSQSEKPHKIFARLNIMHGPDTEQIARELSLNEGEVAVEFDLAYTKVNDQRIERAWVDLIFENPEMSQITLRDLTFSRRPRAAF